MMKEANESFPRNTLRQAELALQGWKDLKGDLLVPNMEIAEFQKKIAHATEKVDLAERLKIERSEAVKVRNESLKVVWDLTKRVRNAAKATFGDSSEKIEKFGGKSSRKRTKR
ncbi:hypothetical protein B6I21_04510, partial [candidate division KSB1 bacterium 4572_119]